MENERDYSVGNLTYGLTRQGEDLVARAVQHTLVAVNCRTWGILEPSAQRGLSRAAAFHERRSADLLDAVCAKGRDTAPVNRAG